MAYVFIKYCKDTNSFTLLKKSVGFSFAIFLPGFGEDAGGDVEGEPGPAEEAVGGGAFESLHRRCAGHEGESEGEGYVFLYLPVGFQLYLVAKGHVHVDVAQTGAHGQVVVVDADAQVAEGIDCCPDECVLQSR